MATDPLDRWERAIALAVGVASGGGGGYAVFASTNQAGTAILLILSALFLLIGIQGTSLIRFSTGSNTVELERRRRRVEQVAAEVAKDDPERAAGIIEGAGLALPDIARADSWLEAPLYERRLETAIVDLGYSVRISPDEAGDFIVTRQEDGSQVYVQAAYSSSSPLGGHRVRDFMARNKPQHPILIVTNAGVRSVVAATVRDDADRPFPVRIVSWPAGADTGVLRNALEELFTAAPVQHLAKRRVTDTRLLS